MYLAYILQPIFLCGLCSFGLRVHCTYTLYCRHLGTCCTDTFTVYPVIYYINPTYIKIHCLCPAESWQNIDVYLEYGAGTCALSAACMRLC
jgi:hypothetical protein